MLNFDTIFNVKSNQVSLGLQQTDPDKSEFWKKEQFMYIYNGNKSDTTDIASNKFLQVNSCGYQQNVKEYTVVREKGRQDYHILFVESGEYEIKFQGNASNLKKGDFVLYCPGDMQWYRSVCTSTSFWCHFTGNVINELLNDTSLCGGIFSCPSPDMAFDAFSRLIKNHTLSGSSLLTIGCFLEFIHRITNTEHANVSVNNHSVVDSTIEYIHKNYFRSITLDTLAKQAGYSKSRLSHLFRDRVGISPIHYLTDVRINNAAEYLLSTDIPIIKIAEMCGFDDSLYFSKCFRKHCHISPREFRREFKD